MKNMLLRNICLAVTVSLTSISCLYPMSLHTVNPDVFYRGQTKEEAFSFVCYLIKELPWFNENGYNDNGHKVSLPMHKDFERLYKNPELLDEKNKDSLRQLFYEEVYDASKFDTSVEAISQTEDVVKKTLKKLAVLQTNWNFKIKQSYDILLTLYGPGGNYEWRSDVGIVKIKTSFGSYVRSKESYAKTVVHEIVHIGIEKDIVQKYHLSHWEKERLVDLICSLYLKDLLPWYENQENADKTVDTFINEEVVIENLPAAIEAFIAQYPRNN
jgi:hypothetical protein